MDVIIFGGQSNMQGQTECLSECEIVPGAAEYKYLTDEAVPLKNPVGEDITYDGKEGILFDYGVNGSEWLQTNALAAACYGHTNMVPSFCRSYIDVTGRDVMAVHAAKGSTTVAQWMPGTLGYDVLVRKSAAALRKADSPDHVWFVWLQGESDAIEGRDKAYYKNMLRGLADGLKLDLGIEKFCVIRVGRFTNDDRDLEIITAQDEICESDPDFLMLTTVTTELNQMPEYMNPEAVGHFGAKGLEYLGSIAGRALGEYCLNLKGV